MSETVKRYHNPVVSIDHSKWGTGGAVQDVMCEVPNGEWVKYSDYQKLESDNKKLEAELNATRPRLEKSQLAHAECVDAVYLHKAHYGCPTGDCPHTDANECVKSLSDVIVDRDKEIAELKRDQIAAPRPAPADAAEKEVWSIIIAIRDMFIDCKHYETKKPDYKWWIDRLDKWLEKRKAAIAALEGKV